MSPQQLPPQHTHKKEARKVSVNTMLTESEAKLLKARARARRATRSTLIREAVLELLKAAA